MTALVAGLTQGLKLGVSSRRQLFWIVNPIVLPATRFQLMWP
jgi:hypothetical protein